MAASNQADDKRRYDFVLFGASGFTGQYTVEEMIRTGEKEKFSWAVAGRNRDKLEKVIEEAFKILNMEKKEIPIIIADVNDATSIGEMCSKAKIVLNCVGPYRFYGEIVVKSCIENGAHHIDISGEPQFLEKMQLEYHQMAKDAGVYVIGSCGFDSIPNEMGVQTIREKFPGDLEYVESFCHFHHGPSGTRINVGTWNSAIHGFAHWKELKPLRQKLFPERLQKGKYLPPKRKLLFYSEEVDGWCVPFPVADKPVIVRTQYHLQAEKKERPFHFIQYARLGNFFTTLLTLMGALIFALFASFNYGRKLLVKYPEVFSAGKFSNEGPTRQQVKESSFTHTLIGVGHEEKLNNPTDQHATPPDTKLVVKVKGPDPGYITTPICMIQSGLVVLEEINKLPAKGGVYTPGGAFVDTTLIKRLSQNGMDFVSGNAFKLNPTA